MKSIILILGKLFVSVLVLSLLFSSCGSLKNERIGNKGNNGVGGDNMGMNKGLLVSATDPDIVLPIFPGDIREFIKDGLGRHMKRYPADAVRDNIQGRVIVLFIVETDGRVSNVRVEQSLYPSLDAVAIRVVKDMPIWTPGKKYGYPVRVPMKVAINFRLQ